MPLDPSQAVATSDHTVIMSCLQGCRITLRLALRSVQTGVLIKVLLDLSATMLWRLETNSASNSALRPRRNQLRWARCLHPAPVATFVHLDATQCWHVIFPSCPYPAVHRFLSQPFLRC